MHRNIAKAPIHLVMLEPSSPLQASYGKVAPLPCASFPCLSHNLCDVPLPVTLAAAASSFPKHHPNHKRT
uniref:Uncharacterized protein n=1 Tax=Rhizophora mucronata TaxID=61149 RepID=A0A2P2LMQ6_RHIMU